VPSMVHASGTFAIGGELVVHRLGFGAALAWLLRRSPAMLPIPGTSSAAHMRENLAAAGIELSEEDLGELGSASAAAGGAHA
jgi:aryl-alcohol dehydrogenase-like predicted oxidoreductase